VTNSAGEWRLSAGREHACQGPDPRNQRHDDDRTGKDPGLALASGSASHASGHLAFLAPLGEHKAKGRAPSPGLPTTFSGN
jgi:hypothetical protein